MTSTRLACAKVLWVALAACSSTDGGGGDPDDPGGSSSTTVDDWECVASDDVTQCERAGGGVRQNYTCSSGEPDCPPSGAADGEDWACIVEETETLCREVVPNPTTAAERPADCDVPAWKAYFCKLGDEQLTERGSSYRIDCDLLADQLTLEPLPSGACNELVDQLELESWTEAAYAGCTAQLSDEITAWCYNTNLQLSQASACE